MKKLKVLLTVISILIIAGCEIGLGSSVDTEAPGLGIDAGIADKVIRGDFALRGKYSDDGSIDSLSAVLKRTDGEGSALSFRGELSEDPKNKGSGTWKINIPAKSRPITDGTYQADVTIKDSVGRTTVQSTIFTIDNTAPVIVLTRPSTAAQADNPDTYGQKFTIEGQAADTNNISRIEIRLFEDKECTKPAADEPVVLKNVPLSISMDAASYDSQGENYIYEGETKDFSINVAKDGKGKPFYCRIYAYDGSSRYLDEGETASAEDEKGNCAEYYYLYKEIYTPVLQYYKITDLYSILNGTYKEEGARAVSPAGVKEVLFKDGKYQKTGGSFILNPKNNPTFTVTGRSPLGLDGKDFEGSANDILNGQSVFIEVSPGLDDIPLEEGGLKVYALECDRNGKEVTGAKKIYPETEREEKGSTYRFTVKIARGEEGEEGLKIGKTYLFGVDGYDQSEAKNLIEPSGKAYGFRMAANGNAPVLTVMTPEDATSYIKKGGKQKFYGTIDVELGSPKLLVYKGSDDEGNLTETIEFSESEGTKTSSGKQYSFSFEESDFGNTNSIHKFILKAEQAGLVSQPVEKTVVYDVDAPTVIITKPAAAKKFLDEKGTEDTQNSYLNGTAEFTVMLNDRGGSGLDSDLHKPEWKILNADDKTVLEEGIITEATGQTISINTAEAKYSGKAIIFRVNAWDAAGNLKTTEADDARYTFKIDQSTDNPYIGEDTGYKKLDFGLRDINAYYSQTGEKKGNVEKGSTLKFRLYEDDGAAKLYVLNRRLTVTSDEGSGTHSITGWETDVSRLGKVFEATVDTPGKLVNVSSYTFPVNDEECGFYEYAIVAEDTQDSSKKSVKGPFLVRITQDKASITVTKDREYANPAVTVTNTITVTPSEGPYRLYRQVVKQNADSAWQTYNDDIDAASDEANATDVSHYKKIGTVADNNLTAEDPLKIESYYAAGEERNLLVYYRVIDELGNASVPKSVELKMDKTAPEVVIKSPVSGKTGTSALTETTQLSGTAADSVSGVTKVWYKITHNDNEELPKGSSGGYTPMEASNGPFTVDKDFISGTVVQAGKLEEGKWYFYVYAEDDAENASEPVKREFDIDMSIPEATIAIDGSKNTYNKEDLAAEGTAGAGSGKIRVTGKALDSQGLVSAVITANPVSENLTDLARKEIALAVTDGIAGNNGVWAQEFIFGPAAQSQAANYLAQGKYDISIKAVDRAGKQTVSQAVSVTIDYTEPVINQATLKLNDVVYDADGWYESKTLKVDIDVTDDVSGVSGVQCITKDSENNDRTSPLSKDNGNTYTGTAQLSKEGADLKIRLKARDIAGNWTEEIEKTVKIDTSAPELEGYKYKVGNGSLKNAGGTVYINENENSTLTVYGNYRDLQSGVRNLSFEGTKKNADETYIQPEITYSTQPAESAADSSYDITQITDENRTSIRSWKAVFANGSTDGIIETGELKVAGKNNAGSSGLSAEKKLFTINLDNEYPQFTKPKIEPNTQDYSVYKTTEVSGAGTTEVYYLNNKEQSFTISGLAEDNNGVDLVHIKIENVDSQGNPVKDLITQGGNTVQVARIKEVQNANGNFTGILFKQADGTVWEGGARVTVTVTDIAGNSTAENNSQTVLNIKFDTKGPYGLHIIDKKKNKNVAGDGTVTYSYTDNGKDLYFRIGDMNRDDGVVKDEDGEVIVDQNKDATAVEGAPEWDKGTAATDTTPAVPSKDKDVGGKYSNETFGNAETVKIRGAFEDRVSEGEQAAEGSGVSLIYYKLYTTEPDNSTVASSPDTQDFLADYKNLADGYFSPLKTPEVKRIFYTDDTDGTLGGKILLTDDNSGKPYVHEHIGSGDSIKYYTEIKSTYKTTISGLSAGNNYIVLVAVDNVGNASLETVTYNGNEYHNYQINVDYEAPSVASSAPATGLYTKSNESLTISGTVYDNPSDVKAGIKDVWLKYTDKDNNEKKIKAAVNGNSWSAEVTSAVLSALYDNASSPKSVIFTATATDKAGSGNSASCTTTVTIDNTVPAVEITGPKGAGTNASGITMVNGAVSIKGSANDSSGIKADDSGKELHLWYKEKDAAETLTQVTSTQVSDGWHEFGQGIENNGSWDITVTDADGNGFSPFTDRKTYYFTVAADDKAGNTGYSAPLALEVNSDSDRPVVKFYTTVSDEMTSASESIDGVISDDDGTPENNKVWYAVTESDAAPDESSAQWKTSGGSTDEVFKYSGGSFSIKPGDGTKYIWFKINDGQNTFISCASTVTSGFATPKITGKDETAYDKTRLKIKTDTTPPSTDSFAYLAKGMDETKEVSDTNTDGWSKSTGTAIFGGTEGDTFRVRIYAYDKNSIQSVKFRIPADSADQSVSGLTRITVTENSKTYYEYTLEKQDVTKTLSDGNTYNLWWIKSDQAIDVRGLASGARPCVIDAFDGAKHTTETYNFNIDNTPAEATFTSHSENDQIRSSFLLKGGFNDGDNKTTLKYILSTSPAEPEASVWETAAQVANVGSNSWNINFDGGTTDSTATHDGLPKQVVASLLSDVEIAASGENAGKAVYKAGVSGHAAGELYKTITTVYFHMMAYDAIGNSKHSKLSLRLDPQGDIPTIKMIYPAVGTETAAADDPITEGLHYTKLSGYIRAQGSAEDDKNIVGIYMQIDPDFNGTFASNWNEKECPGNTAASEGTPAKTTLSDFGYTIEDMFTSYNTYHGYASTDTGYKTGTAAQKGIKVGTSASWSITLNTGSEFNKNDANNYIAIKFYAVDEDGNISIWNNDDLVIVCVDSDAPKIGSSEPLYVYQYGFKDSTGTVYYSNTASPAAGSKLYSDSGCRTEAAGKTYSSENYTSAISSAEYKKDMWLKGEWWLKGSIEDESGIAEVKLGGMGGTSIKETDCTAESWSSAGTSGYVLNYRIGSTDTTSPGYGTVTYNIWVQDDQQEGSRKDTTLDISVKYDNKAPTLAPSTDSDYSISKDVVNDNGFYRVQSVVTEAASESGFDKVLFYFKRGNTTVYDSYMAKGNPNNALAVTDPDLTKDSDIYWKSNTITEVSANVITVSADTNIHTGGLAKVGGVIYTITDVNGTSVTLDGNPASSVAGTTALFAVGHVVDHEGTESEGTSKISATESAPAPYGLGYYGNSPDDDGDFMLEKVSRGATRTLWYGLINSRNIPDGSIEIHYVAFDKAGNMAHGEVTDAFVKNNGPRLAGLRVWTDYNGDGTEQDDESKVSYYNEKQRKIGNSYEGRATDVTEKLVVSGNGSDWTETGDKAATSFMRITDETRFYPEIVGGNGHLYYSYRIGTGTDPDSWTTAAGSSGTTAFSTRARIEYSDTKADYMTNDDQPNPESYVNGSALDAITADTTLLGNVGNGPKWFEYTIWDSTEGKKPFNASGTQVATTLSAKFAVLLNVDYADETPPTAVISPFFWNNLNSNSIYGSAAKDANDNYVVNSVHDLAGHIELESDLTGTQAAATYGSDPKVSGKITIRGTAYDNIRLKQLWVKFDDLTLAVDAGNDISGTNPDSSRSDYVLAAVYSKTTATETEPSVAYWKPAMASMDSQFWSFSATDEYCNKDGHLVNWELSIDTSKVTGGAGLNNNVLVMTVAERGEGSNSYSSVTAGGTAPADDDYSKAAETYNKPYYQMDIVPYVSELKTSLSSFNSGESKGVYDRTALGHYPVYMTHAQGDGTYDFEIVRIEGFNLAGTSVLFTPETEGATVTKEIKKYKVDANTKKYVEAEDTDTDWFYGFQLDAGIKSGEISVQNADGTVSSLNNMNSNLAHGSAPALADSDVASGDLKAGKAGDYATLLKYYNRQPNNTNNNRLTDDLYLDIWDFNSEAAIAINDSKVDDAIMKVNPNSGIIGFSFSNGSERFSMGGNVGASVSDDNEFSYYEWNMTYDKMSYNSFAYDITGRSYGTTSGGDINAEDNTSGWDFFSFMSDRWGQVFDHDLTYLTSASNKNNNGTSYTPSRGKYNICPEGIGQKPNTIKKDRIQSASIATIRYKADVNATDNDATHIYLAYYDLINDEIRFRFLNLKDTVTNASTITNSDGTFIDVRGIAPNDKGRTDYNQTANSGQIVASNSNPSGTLGNAGNSVALGVTSNNTVVIVWYDSENEELKISWNTTPTQTSDTVDGQEISRLGASKAGWADAQTLIPNAGEYCQLAVAADNSVHVVAYDSSSGDLKYAYVPYNDTDNIPNYSGRKTCAVDSYLDTGTQLSLDVVGETRKVNGTDKTVYIPHIGYWTAYPEKAHYAYLNDYDTFINAAGEANRSGADSNDKYTGIWECGVVPSVSSIKEGKINVGLWKKTDGSRRNSNYTGTAGANADGTNMAVISTANGTNGKCYGNGTDNAVLAYVVMPSSSTYHIETAQMR